MRKTFEIRLGETVDLESGHTFVVTGVYPGRCMHRLYVKEDDQGLKVSHIVTVFNDDIMIMGGMIYLTGCDLGDIISAK